MEFFDIMFFTVILLAVVMESVDSSLGMMYGTILSPLLLGLGFDPQDVVPALVISQAVGGISASFQHHRFRNASFDWHSKDLKVAAVVFSMGILAVIVGAVIGVKVNKFVLSLYISVLMLVMGIIVFAGVKFRFSWNKIMVLGLVSSFNKALSGGGFGPIITSGQMIVGRSSKRSVGATTMSEVEICIASFVAWWIISQRCPSLPLITALCVGAFVGGLIGPYILSRIKNIKLLTKLVAVMAIASGLFALIEIITK